MIFIAGNSRSGTTLMGRILGNHPDVFTFHEMHFLEEKWMPVAANMTISECDAITLFANLISIERDGYLKNRQAEKYLEEATLAIKNAGTKEITFDSLYADFLYYETRLHHKKTPSEKTPRNVLYINELLKIYYDCKIICLMRDPKDVLLSQKKKWKRRFLGAAASIPLRESIRARINYHPYIISKLWNTNALAVAAQKNAERVKIIYFEKLISEPEITVRDICTFLNIPFHGNMLRVEQKGSSVQYDNTGEAKIDKSKTGSWKQGLNNTEVFICEKVTRMQRQQFGYEDTGIKPSYFMLAYYFIIFPFQMMLAVLLNLGRTKNIFASIKKRFA